MKQKTKNTILTDGGLETDLIFNHRIELEHFAAFPLLENRNHLQILENYYRDYLELAKLNGTGFILESPTWRANLDWGKALGYDEQNLKRVNKLAIQKMKQLKQEYKTCIENVMVSGQIGPRGDGYKVDTAMNPAEAQAYHNLQVGAFETAKVDMVTAITMTYIDEALGIVESAKNHKIPVVISFTVELDGSLPSGETLEQAITAIDKATENYPKYYMINCAHPTHFMHLLEGAKSWKNRIQGLRANASCKSHAELDESTELDVGNKIELGQLHRELQQLLPNLEVFGGCCGTDASHVKAICDHISLV
ncbi:homocysteine S-methyltransferase family protein [Flagellimonas sp.]|uniref:homocysteine S-methyltransferase family protein n=1 Tax=Flagellimonas sp. TaxID=2058762 RepID=UPI003B5233A4